jgi:hypothetical protein
LVDVGQKRHHCRRRRRGVPHRIGHERKRPAAQRLLHQPRLDVHDAIAKAGCRRRGAVVQLIRMQHVQLPGQAAPKRPTVAKRLHAASGDADRVGVVAVRLERAAREEGLHPLDAVSSRADPDGAATGAARSFKTAGVDGR